METSKETVDVLVHAMVAQFNLTLHEIQKKWDYGVNFAWRYDDQGFKYLDVVDVAKVTKPTAEAVAEAKEKVPKIMEQAEALVGRPFEVGNGPSND